MIFIEKDCVERFNSKFKKRKNGCWEWTASILKDGYGCFSVKGKTKKAHRVSWLIHKGEIPKFMCVLHKCDNRKCVNPSHLWIGTYLENSLDAKKKGRLSKPKGTLHPMCKLTEKDVIKIRKMECSSYKISKIFGVNSSTIRKIKLRQRWTHI